MCQSGWVAGSRQTAPATIAAPAARPTAVVTSGFPGDHPEDLSARRSDQPGQPDLVASIGDGHRGRVDDRDRGVAGDRARSGATRSSLLLLRRVDLVEVLGAAEHGGCRHAPASCPSAVSAAPPPVT